MVKLLLLLHRWTGIVLAAYVVMMGLTGAALVVHDDAARRFRMPAVPDAGGTPLDADQVVERIYAAFPDWHLQTLWWPDTAYQPAWFGEIRRGAVGAIGEHALAVYVDPRSGVILRTHDYSRSPWRWMQLLHFNLMAGLNGRQVNGVLALATLFSALTGGLLWWRNRIWWRTHRPRRLWWDLHQVAGIYVAPFLLIACLTGSYFAWRADVHRVMATFVPFRFMNQPVTRINPPPQPPFRSLASFEARLREIVSAYPVTRVLFPDQPDQPLRFVIYEGSRRDFHKASNLFFDPSSGALLRADLLRDRLPGDSIVQWIGAVHFGAFGGWPVQLAWMLGGVTLAVVGILGIVLFVQRQS